MAITPSHKPNGFLDEQFISAALEQVEYERVGYLVYRARWSTYDVEHFLYLSTYGSPGTPEVNLTGHFGLRNILAEKFSVECIRKFGGELYRTIQRKDNETKMIFGFSRLLAPEGRWYISLLNHSTDSVASLLCDAVRNSLFSAVRPILELKELGECLLSDKAPFEWFATNGGIRSAHVAAVLFQQGAEKDKIQSVLKPYLQYIGQSVGAGASDTRAAEAYIIDVTNFWFSSRTSSG